jgi:hypothetical protein
MLDTLENSRQSLGLLCECKIENAAQHRKCNNVIYRGAKQVESHHREARQIYVRETGKQERRYDRQEIR